MARRRTRPRSSRRYMAVATCVLWLLGIEVLPNLHLAAHDEHHTHAAGGAIVHRPPAAHHHGHHHHHHGALAEPARDDAGPAAGDRAQPIEPDREHRARRAPRPGDAIAIDQPSSGHAAAGIAHHAMALHRPPPPLLEPLSVIRTARQIEVSPDLQLSHAPLARPTARGPPATA